MAVFDDYTNVAERRKAENRRRLIRKIVMGVFFTIAALLFVVVAAVVATTLTENNHRDHHHAADNEQHSKKSESHDDNDVSESNKLVSSICSVVQYRPLCESSISHSVSSNAQPKEVVKAAIRAAVDEHQQAARLPETLPAGDAMHQAALADCKELLSSAVDELQRTFSGVDSHDVLRLSEISSDLRTWLSAVLSYQDTCLEGVQDPALKEKLHKGLENATQLTSNALAIVSQFSSILSLLQIPTSLAHRRLLSQTSNDHGVPEWVPHADRRYLKAGPPAGNVKPDAVVAKDGSGNYTTIQAALDGMPKKPTGRYVIYVKEGVYDETVTVAKEMVNVMMYGDGSRKTIITGSKNFVDGTPTFRTAPFVVIGDGFIARNIGFRNTAGAAKHQAVALRVQSDRSAFINCRMEGYQDTLYAHSHRQFYRSCVITGTIDFIFGDAAVILQNCMIVVRKPLANQQNTITAHGRTDKHESTGIVIHNCKIIADKKLVPDRLTVPSYLGRPWKQYSRTIVMESTIGDLIRPEGWLPWDGTFALDTLSYGEYNNKGPGAAVDKRVNWKGFKVIEDRNEALGYTADKFIQGGEWIKDTGSPVSLTLLQ